MFGTFGFQEMMIIGVVAVLLFGKRLPEVARNVGKTFGEFKKGMQGFQREMNSAMYSAESETTSRYDAPSYDDTYDDTEEATAPKFEPPSAEPQPEPAEKSPSA